jgi:hypothetical protein
MESLQRELASAYFNEENHIAFIAYRGILTGEESTAVYDWLADLVEEVGLENIYGEVFDFRLVSEFAADNLMEARRNSRRHNMRNNVRNLPVAMIISNYYQEEILRGPMQNVEENKRKTIVWNMDDAIAFLEEWHVAQEPDVEETTEIKPEAEE